MIIAEIGQNFMGNMELAKRMIELAKANGATLAKFQLYDHQKLYKDHPEIPDYSLTFGQAKALFNYGIRNDIEVFFSVFDVERVKWCEEIGVKRYKLSCGFVHWASGQNVDLAEAIIDTGKEAIISYSRVPDRISFMSPARYLFFEERIKKLYCVPKYPALLSDIHFPDFTKMEGFSDHTIGLDAAKIAIARGAQIIEKHFAVDHHTGVDAPWSMTPSELKELALWEAVVKESLG